MEAYSWNTQGGLLMEYTRRSTYGIHKEPYCNLREYILILLFSLRGIGQSVHKDFPDVGLVGL
jgi:hypothetical protein